MAKSTEIAWAAGFFEGEGCFYAHQYRPRKSSGIKMFRTMATVTQKDREPLDMFRRIVGFGNIYFTSKGRVTSGGVHSPIYTWKSANATETKRLFSLLESWLSLRRRQTAQRLFALEQNQVWRPLKSQCLRGHVYTETTTRMRKDGSRRCIPCQNEDNAKRVTTGGR